MALPRHTASDSMSLLITIGLQSISPGLCKILWKRELCYVINKKSRTDKMVSLVQVIPNSVSLKDTQMEKTGHKEIWS